MSRVEDERRITGRDHIIEKYISFERCGRQEDQCQPLRGGGRSFSLVLIVMSDLFEVGFTYGRKMDGREGYSSKEMRIRRWRGGWL